MTQLASIAVFLACLAAGTGLAAREGGPLLLVLNKGDLTLAIVDASTLQVVAAAPSGPDPHEVIASADGRLAFITNYTQGNRFANSLSVVDLVTRAARPPIDLGALSRPHGVALAGTHVYITAEGSKAVGRLDPPSGRIDWIMGTGQDGTHMVIASSDGQRVFTTNLGSATVSILETTRSPQRPDWSATVVPVGRGAEGFDLSPDGKELWIANAADSTVSILDPSAKKVVQTLNVPFRRANRLKFTPDGSRVFVSDLGGSDVIVLDAAGRREVKRIDVGGGSAGIQMAPDGSRAFVSVGPRDAVVVIDPKTLTVTGEIRTGQHPDGLAWVAR